VEFEAFAECTVINQRIGAGLRLVIARFQRGMGEKAARLVSSALRRQ
jgi:hypothetical protein